MAVNFKKLFGHKYDWREVDAFCSLMNRPVFGTAAVPLKDTGKGKAVLLHKLVEQVAGYFPVHGQTIGDCVSHGFGGAVDAVKCVEIAREGEPESWEAETATEPIYGYSRVEIGKGQLGRGDGSVGAWGARTVTEGGTLLRRKYDKWDFSKYDGQRAKAFGMPKAGVPDELEPTMREHPISTASLVTSYEEARDAIANGYPVVVCSNQGFREQRDNEGFAKPSGSWSHCMYFLDVDDEYKRPGLLCVNSWGNQWINGPKRHDQPDGTFWTDADVADKMLRTNPDSYALSGYVGFPSRPDIFTLI